MSLIARAIDVGWGNTKYVTTSDKNGIKCAHFRSVAPHSAIDRSVDPIGGRRKTVSVLIDDLYYEVGPEVELALNNFQPRHFSDKYTESAEYRALTTGALSYIDLEHIDLLVLGLPVAHFTAKRQSLKKAMTGSFSLGRKKKVEVEHVEVLAQPQGALWDYASRNGLDSLKHGRSLVIDAGSRTFDWLTTQGMKVVSTMSHSVNRGVSDILLGIASKLSAELKEDFHDLDAIDRTLRSQKQVIRIYQREYDLTKHRPLIQKIADQAVAEMIQSMNTTSDIENIVLVGGGAHLFKKAVQRTFPKHVVHEVPDPLYANVRGYQFYAEQLLSDRPDNYARRSKTLSEASAELSTAPSSGAMGRQGVTEPAGVQVERVEG